MSVSSFEDITSTSNHSVEPQAPTDVPPKAISWLNYDHCPQTPQSDTPPPSTTAPLLKPRAPYEHDPGFYFEDVMAVFLVEERLFKVHRYFLDRESPNFPKGTGSDEHPIELYGASCLEFGSLLNFFYNGMSGDFTLALPQWIALLSIATRFQMGTVRSRAIFEITKLRSNIDAVDQIVLALEYKIPAWLQDAYILLCERSKPLTAQEAKKLGDEIPFLVCEARESILMTELAELKSTYAPRSIVASTCTSRAQTPPPPPPPPPPGQASVFGELPDGRWGSGGFNFTTARGVNELGSPRSSIVRRVVDEVFGREERERLAMKDWISNAEVERKLKEAREAKEKAERVIMEIEDGCESERAPGERERLVLWSSPKVEGQMEKVEADRIQKIPEVGAGWSQGQTVLPVKKGKRRIGSGKA